MATYRELLDKLLSMSQDQLDSEIKVFPVGYTDSDAAMLLNYQTLPQVLEITKASRDIYYFAPSDEDGEWCEPGMCDFAEDEIRDMGIAEDEDYTLVCHKGETILKIRDGIALANAEVSKAIDTGIMPL